MSEKAIVTARNGDMLTLSLTRKEACGHCRACIAGLSAKEMILEAQNACGADVNDEVIVELEKDFALKAAVFMYGMPMSFTILGLLAGYFAAPFLHLGKYAELFMFGAGVLFMLFGYAVVRFCDKRLDKRPFVPIARRVLKKGGQA